MIIPFCETEYQSIAIGLTVGILSGFVSVVTGSLVVGIAVAIKTAIGLEIALHEYRQDEQYVQAKRQLRRVIQ